MARSKPREKACPGKPKNLYKPSACETFHLNRWNSAVQAAKHHSWCKMSVNLGFTSFAVVFVFCWWFLSVVLLCGCGGLSCLSFLWFFFGFFCLVLLSCLFFLLVVLSVWSSFVGCSFGCLVDVFLLLVCFLLVVFVCCAAVCSCWSVLLFVWSCGGFCLGFLLFGAGVLIVFGWFFFEVLCVLSDVFLLLDGSRLIGGCFLPSVF